MKSIHYTTLMLLAAGAAFGHSAGPDPGLTGAPGESTCLSCHSGSSVNPGPIPMTISFPDPNGYVAGLKYRIRVTLSDPTAKRWGFQMTDRKEASTVFAGAFATVSGTNTTRIITQSGIQYIEQTSAGTYPQQVMQAGWDVDWTAPAVGTGTVRFYAAGNAANNNGDLTGDKIYTTNLAVAEQQASQPPPAITAGNTVLSQFVFGGGWYTAMYFTNQSAAPVSFNVNFYNDSAVPMSVGGTTFKTVLVPAGGTSIVEAQNAGSSLTSGWATFDAPAGVTGYGVFRQSVAGKGDQEAVVPFASSTGTKALLTFDESAYTTGIAIWYNGASNATVTLTAKDESGNALGAGTLMMTPGTKQSFAVTDKIAAISGHRGSLVVSTSTGSVAVLGLRFGGSAFTSIPATAVN